MPPTRPPRPAAPTGRVRRAGAALLAGALLLAAAACGPDAAGGAAAVRVDQVGYAAAGPKIAYLMTDGDDDAPFEVRDENDAVVLRGTAGGSRGEWSDRYPAVRPLDLTALRDPGRYRIVVARPAATSPWFAVAADPHAALADRAVRFFQAQRDGADVVPGVLDRRPAHLADRTATRYDAPEYDGDTLTGPLAPAGGTLDAGGGWYDAGDYLKFTHTAAYATIALLLAQRERRAAAGTPLAREAAFGLAWLDRMYDARTGTLHAQVGLGDGGDGVLGDHDRWRLPQRDDATRPARGDNDYYLSFRPVFPAHAGTDGIPGNLAGRVAAALALGARLTADRAAARRLLTRAAAILDRADPGATVTTYPGTYYTDGGAEDDLALGAAELSLAATRLGDPRAARWRADATRWATAHARDGDVAVLGAADVSALAIAELLPVVPAGPDRDTLLAGLRAPLAAAGDRAAKDPFGAAAPVTRFDAVPQAFGLAATAALYRRAGGGDEFTALGAGQRAWALGGNAWGVSFMIGAGTTYPRCPHHQIANLTGERLDGAVVNGPNKASLLKGLATPSGARRCAGVDVGGYDGGGGAFRDATAAWPTAEPAIDFTASALLAVALP
ncbi:hydrolase [Pilimelia anulata]|uniref:Hydrolase n=1 Tax=Pilimelia anulata TaxID=53371 RepID=A0A8J3AZT9_9ACTN|nr:glycoside hydrolase family 9 protein [Pilimelia anulata]GGJ75940.1 hydrolase [Pilimelia anulata]